MKQTIAKNQDQLNQLYSGQGRQNRKIHKVQQMIPGPQSVPQNTVPVTNFNSTQRLRFSQSNKKGSVERGAIQQSKLNIMPYPTTGQYSSNSTHTIQTGMNSATNPAQLIMHDRSLSTNFLNNTVNHPIQRPTAQLKLLNEMETIGGYNQTQLLDRLFN